MLNIGIIHGFVGGGGGTEKTLHAIIDALEKTDHKVTLYTFSKPSISSKKVIIKSSLPISIPAFGLYQRMMESKLISKAKDEDILIQASGGLGLPKNPDQKIIVYCHSDFTNELESPSTKYRGIWSLYYKSYYRTVKRFLENIQDSRIYLISNSKLIHDSIKSKYNKDSVVFYPPVNLKEFSPTQKENLVVTIGRFSDEKNLEFGIDVMKKINSQYEIIGNTKTKINILYYEKLQSKILRDNLGGKIRLLKNIQRPLLVNCLNKAKVYFHCSRETFGITTVEGIAAGCIPIVSDIFGHKETVPFSELRYAENDHIQAEEKITCALNGEFDYRSAQLKEHIKKYDREEFMVNIIKYIESLE